MRDWISDHLTVEGGKVLIKSYLEYAMDSYKTERSEWIHEVMDTYQAEILDLVGMIYESAYERGLLDGREGK